MIRPWIKPFGTINDVKFFTPYPIAGTYGGPVDNTPGANPTMGLCQICHTQTTFWKADGTGTGHYEDKACLTCHDHAAGFAAVDDLDLDGYLLANDCNDNDPNINPGMPEIPYNGVDENCSGMTDDDDLDLDGYPQAVDCDDNDPLLNLTDTDGDGYSTCTGECDDNDAVVNPDNMEICRDGIDNSCDGLVDDQSCTRNFEICDDNLDNDGDRKVDCSDNYCADDPACNMCTPTEASELSCEDGADNDCDGLTDCDDSDCTDDPICVPAQSCSDYSGTDQTTCEDNGCKWNKNKDTCS